MVVRFLIYLWDAWMKPMRSRKKQYNFYNISIPKVYAYIHPISKYSIENNPKKVHIQKNIAPGFFLIRAYNR